MLRWLISTVGFAALKGELAAASRRAGQRASLFVLIVVLWLAAFGFAVAALTAWLVAWLGPIAACGIIAGSLALVALVLMGVMRAVQQNREKHRPSIIPGFTGADGKPGLDFGNPGTLALIALAAYLFGRGLSRK